MSITGLLLSSLLLIVAAAGALVYGWVNASEPLVVSSIAFSVASAIFMAMGLYRSRPRRTAGKRPQPKKKRARAGRSDR
jgi:membrane protein implicated in regulation of membrane protease activity